MSQPEAIYRLPAGSSPVALPSPHRHQIMIAAVVIQLLFLSLGHADVEDGLATSSLTYPGLEDPIMTTKRSRSRGAVEEDNLERLCNDPFHSFLCKPVTSRRSRIDGRLRPGAVLPPGILSEATNIEVSSQPLESGADQRRRKSYYSTPQTKSSQNAIESRYQRTNSSRSDKTEDSQVPLRAASRSRGTIRHGESRDDLSRKTTKSSDDFKRTSEQFLERQESRLQKLQQKPSNKLSRKYLPVDETNVSPESSNISPNIDSIPPMIPPTNSRQSKKEDNSLERICNDAFHSFLCKPGKQRRRIDGRIREGAKIPPNVLVGASSIVREARVLPPNSGSVQSSSLRRRASLNYVPPNTDKIPASQQTYLPPNSQSGGYQYPKPSNNQPVTYGAPSIPVSTTTVKAISNGYYYPKPSNQFPPSNSDGNGYNYPKPTTNLPSITENIQTTISQDSTGESGYSYSKPSEAFTLPTTQKPNDQMTTEQTSIATDKPSNGYLSPANNQSTEQGYNYDKPAVQLTLPSTENPEVQTSPTTSSPIEITTNEKPTTGYSYPKPNDVEENVASPAQSGYIYEKPSIDFTYPTPQQPQQTQPNIPTTQSPSVQTSPSISITTVSNTNSGYDYPKPNNIQENAGSSSQNGYVYSKPSIAFTYPPTTQKPDTDQEGTSGTTAAPTENPKPNIQETASSDQEGYDYPKPAEPFPPASNGTPSTENPLTFTTSEPEANPTTTGSSSGYDYPNPNQNGYFYDKPQNGLTLPTKKPATLTETTTSPTTGNENPDPSNVEQEIRPPSEQTGYNYPQPSTLLTLPTTYIPPTAAPTEISQTTTQLAQASSESGYNYPKPAVGFTYPPPSQVKPQSGYLPPQGSPSQIGVLYQRPTSRPVVSPAGAFQASDNQGYQYQKPAITFTLPPSKRSARHFRDSNRSRISQFRRRGN